ncbi:lipoyl synthase [Buchnera aphidicola]|uniref:lipoyl synthase n=1 Tax=Buchnera aphidicola TaxID=9 RepID=UPI0030EC14C1
MSKKKFFLKKPKWIRIKLPENFNKIQKIKNKLRKNNLHTVCESAQCPNLSECFSNGTVTFMILGNICTRKCNFCAVLHGRPHSSIVDSEEPKKILKIVNLMKINHVVITSVNRDDLKDGGAQHFANCIKIIKKKNPNIKVEILVPDFKKKHNLVLKILKKNPPDIFNHNIENVPRLYKKVRPGSNYKNSLNLLYKFKVQNPNIPTKSGLMLGLGETLKEVIQVLKDLKNHGVSMITIGQYLQPSKKHFPVQKYASLKEFSELEKISFDIGFKNVFCGPLVRSSYHADIQ